MRCTRLCASALAAITFGIAPAAARSANVTSLANAQLYGTIAADSDTGPGTAPVASSASHARSEPLSQGQVAASASAALGVLGARASVTVSNAPGYFSPLYPLYGESEAWADAVFNDRWTFGGRPLDTPGVLRLGFTFDGSATSSATGATPYADGIFRLSLLGLGEFGGVHDSASYDSGPLTIAAEQGTLELEFLYGRPIVVSSDMYVRVDLVSFLDVYSYSGAGEAVFDQTGELVSLEVQDAGGQWSTSYELTTESGGTYPFQVPEPAIPLAGAVALASLSIRRARAG